MAAAAVVIAAAQTLPPLPEQARDALERSPRHGEWGTVEPPSGGTRFWLMFPERRDAAPAVVVLRRAGELDDWTRALVDHLAASGYIAVAPELPPGPDADVRERIERVRAHAAALPAANRRSAIVVLDDATGALPADAFTAAVPVFRVDVTDDRGRALQRAWPRVLAFLSDTFR